MTCHDIAALLPGYLDSELDLIHSLEVERHVASCAACTETLERDRSLRSRIAAAALSYRSPPHLVDRIRAGLNVPPSTRPERRRSLRPWALLATGIAAGLLLSLSVYPWLQPPGDASQVAQQVVDCHVRSLMADHLFDVASSDQHTVKPWFNGRLNFAPWVADLQSQDFSLRGGRLDYLGNRAVAALVFQRRRHFINLFMWPSQAESRMTPARVRSGFQTVHWSSGGIEYWAVSDLNGVELAEFARLVATPATRAEPGPTSAIEN